MYEESILKCFCIDPVIIDYRLAVNDPKRRVELRSNTSDRECMSGSIQIQQIHDIFIT